MCEGTGSTLDSMTNVGKSQIRGGRNQKMLKKTAGWFPSRLGSGQSQYPGSYSQLACVWVISHPPGVVIYRFLFLQ